METTPDELWSPDAVDIYNLVPDLAAMLGTVQDALIARAFYLGPMTQSERDSISTPVLREGVLAYNTTSGALEMYRSGTWRLASGTDRQKAFTWTRANVDGTAQYPELVADGVNTTESALASFQRVSGGDPDGVGGVKIPAPGVYSVSISVALAAVATGRSYVQIGANSDFYMFRTSVPNGETELSAITSIHTTVADQVIPLSFLKNNGSLGLNTGRVMVRRLG